MTAVGNLPPELFRSAVLFLPPWHLPAVSLVCRRWQAIAFPILYRTLFITSYRTTNRLVDRILKETDSSPLRISLCARNLYVDLNPTEFPLAPTEEEPQPEEERDEDGYLENCLADQSATEQAFLKLQGLTNVYWGDDWLLQDTTTLLNLSNHLKLQSVGMHVPIYHLAPIFGLKNLTKLSLTIERVLTWDEKVDEDERLNIPAHLIRMLRASPNLESLNLSFSNKEHGDTMTAHWNPKVIFQALTDHRFPHLRVLKLKSNWLSPCPSIEQFIRNHPLLRKIKIDRNKDVCQAFDTSDITTTMPSVQNFSGSALLARSLLTSRRSAQLITIKVLDFNYHDQTENPSTLRDVHTSLPRLVKLQAPSNSIEDIANIAMAAPNIENLKISGQSDFYIHGSDYSKNHLEVLKFVPQLRTLGFAQAETNGQRKPKPKASELKSVIEHVKDICPLLTRINHSNGPLWLGTLGIDHRDNVSIGLHWFFHSYFDDVLPGIDVARTARPDGIFSRNLWLAYGRVCRSFA